MSWFTELTSKAEAMLVKLDQDAAQALQQSDRLLSGSKLFDQALNTISTYRGEIPESESSVGYEQNSKPEDSASTDSHANQPDSYVDRNSQGQIISTSQLPDKGCDPMLDEPNHVSSIPSRENNSHRDTIGHSEIYENGDKLVPTIPDGSSTETPEHDEINRYSHKFTIQTSNSSARLYSKKLSNRKLVSSSSRGLAGTIGLENQQMTEALVVGPEANDIRASINRSLREYTIQSSSGSLKRWSRATSKETPYTSHFDSRPNLINHASLLVDSNYEKKVNSSRLHSSPSFSIDVPDDGQEVRPDLSNIATRLRQSTSRKDTTSYLHRVINTLANTTGHTHRSIIGDQLKLKFRRAQLRSASYARRLNYYFRTYPMMKYLMLVYLLLMQLLVVYVLFFYQSSSSSTVLSSQIKHQQEELFESGLNNNGKSGTRDF